MIKHIIRARDHVLPICNAFRSTSMSSWRNRNQPELNFCEYIPRRDWTDTKTMRASIDKAVLNFDIHIKIKIKIKIFDTEFEIEIEVNGKPSDKYTAPFLAAKRHEATFKNINAVRAPSFNIKSHWLVRMLAAPLPQLKTFGLYDTTYIIITSDNGYQLSKFSMPYDKRQPYDTDIRVPLLIGQFLEATNKRRNSQSEEKYYNAFCVELEKGNSY